MALEEKLTEEQVESKFNKALLEWIKHCGTSNVLVSSSLNPIIDCDAYREIVLLKYKALPLIRKTYDIDSEENLPLQIVQGHGLVAAVRKIIGDDFEIPDAIRGHISAMEAYTKRWLNENMHKYKNKKNNK